MGQDDTEGHVERVGREKCIQNFGPETSREGGYVENIGLDVVG
jgi:hypothetical protein